MKSLVRLALVAAALVLARPTAASAQAASNVRLSPWATHVIDSIVTTARATHAETAACITQYAVDSVFYIEIVKPAHYARADSVTIWTEVGTGLCAIGVPTIHTHIVHNPYQHEPSVTDRVSEARFHEPFALIVVVADSSWSLVRY